MPALGSAQQLHQRCVHVSYFCSNVFDSHSAFAQHHAGACMSSLHHVITDYGITGLRDYGTTSFTVYMSCPPLITPARPCKSLLPSHAVHRPAVSQTTCACCSLSFLACCQVFLSVHLLTNHQRFCVCYMPLWFQTFTKPAWEVPFVSLLRKGNKLPTTISPVHVIPSARRKPVVGL